jgi:hypothetical protein
VREALLGLVRIGYGVEYMECSTHGEATRGCTCALHPTACAYCSAPYSLLLRCTHALRLLPRAYRPRCCPAAVQLRYSCTRLASACTHPYYACMHALHYAGLLGSLLDGGSRESLLCGGRLPNESSRVVGIVEERSVTLPLPWAEQLMTETQPSCRSLSDRSCLSDCSTLCTGFTPSIPPLITSRLMLP